MKTMATWSMALLLGVSTAYAQAPEAAQSVLSEHQARTRLAEQGYTKVDDLRFVDGAWKADARSAEGNRVDVRIDAQTGQVYPDEQIANLSETDVRAHLAAAGYSNVHDVDYKNGVWNAEADDANGRDVELKVDPATGKVIGKDKD